MEKIEILKSAHEQRINEVLSYQINIDNYKLAIKHIEQSGDADLTEFRGQLERLLSSEIIEQKKAKVMLAVIEQQLEVV